MKKETLTQTREGALSKQFAFATKAGQLIFVSGKSGVRADGKAMGLADLDEEARKLLSSDHTAIDTREGPIKAQTYWVYSYIKNTLEAIGCTLEDILKQTIYMTDLNEFPAMAQVRKLFFKNPPATTTVGVTGLCPLGSRIEIEVIVLKPEESEK